MSPTIKSYLQVFPLLWWCGLLLLASGAVALFPFDNISFNYLIRPKVLAVIVNTLGIGMIILVLEFWVGYYIFGSGLWRRSPGRAVLMHALGGVILPATVTFAMILLVYPPSIIDDDRFQWDIMFMLLLLIVLNFWLANSMLLHAIKSAQDIGDKLASDKDKLLLQVKFLRSEIDHYKKDAEQYKLSIATTDKTVNGLIEGKNRFAVQLDRLQDENSRQLSRIQQLETERNLEMQARIQAEQHSQELLLELSARTVLAQQGTEGAVDQQDRSDGVFHLKVKDNDIVI